jgi:hypothetical protein
MCFSAMYTEKGSLFATQCCKTKYPAQTVTCPGTVHPTVGARDLQNSLLLLRLGLTPAGMYGVEDGICLGNLKLLAIPCVTRFLGQ